MVDKKWFEAWQQFVDYNETNSGSGETPGLIDNGDLFDNSNSDEIKGDVYSCTCNPFVNDVFILGE